MGRSRVLVAGLAAVVGVAAIGAGVRMSMRDPSSSLATDNTVIPEADVPSGEDAGEGAETATTFDLGVLAPTATTSTAPPSTATTAPKTTTTTLSRNFAIVHVNNTSSLPVKVTLGDETEHAATIAAGEGVNWVVKTSATNPDSATARLTTSNCGVAWSDTDNIVGGREYHLEVKASNGFCASRHPMPMIALTDYTGGGSKSFTGLAPGPNQALVYVVNKYGAPVKLTVSDDDTREWTLDPNQWGTPRSLMTSTEHGDSISLTRLDEQCGYGDGHDYFQGGVTYILTVIDSHLECESGLKAPALEINTVNTSSYSYFNSNRMPHTG